MKRNYAARVLMSAVALVGLIAWTATPVIAALQAGAIRGRIVHSVTSAPIANAVVLLEEAKRETRSDRDGAYSFDRLAAGTYHVLVTAPGFHPLRLDAVVADTPVTLEVLVNPELHYTEVVSVSPDARNQFESYQPTTVLAGQDLAKQLQGSLGATLSGQAGIAERSFGPGPSRPVIRGFDGDRVLILEDGQRMGDLSSQSGDHGVNVNPAAATKVEVVRGPATLLYGSSAIGGLVNVISDDIPTQRINGVSGGFTADLGSAAKEGGAASDMLAGNNRWALRAGASGRRTGDVKTPDGTIDNTQSRAGFGNVGLSWTGDKGYFGGSYAYDDTKYGIPIVESGQIQLTPRRHSLSLRTGASGLTGPLASFRATLGTRRYKHEELDEGEVGTAFENNTVEAEFIGNHRALGRLKGSIGGWAMDRDFSATGEEALSPPIDERGFAFFLYEELTWPHATLQFGARADRATFRPREEGFRNRDFTNGSGSVGLLLRPEAANDKVTLAFSLASAARHPALEELYYFGPHPGNFAFEIGNEDLEAERALGFDASLRWRAPRASGEVTYFRNTIKNYIFRLPISEAEFISNFGGLPGENEDFPIVAHVAADSVVQGVEAHADVSITQTLLAEFGFDLVRGRLTDGGVPLPRIPPARFRGGLRYQPGAWQLGGEVIATAKQDRVLGDELPTDGYTLLKLFAAYSFQAGDAVHTLTARLDNATDEHYRNHLSFIKDFVPEMGRNVKLIYSVRF